MSKGASQLVQRYPCQRRINGGGTKEALEVDGAPADGGKSDCPRQSNEPVHAEGQVRRHCTGGMAQSFFQERADSLAVCDERGDETSAGFVQNAGELVARR